MKVERWKLEVGRLKLKIIYSFNQLRALYFFATLREIIMKSWKVKIENNRNAQPTAGFALLCHFARNNNGKLEQ